MHDCIFPVGKREVAAAYPPCIRGHTDAYRIAYRRNATFEQWRYRPPHSFNRSRCLNASRNSEVSCRMELSNGSRYHAAGKLYCRGKKEKKKKRTAPHGRIAVRVSAENEKGRREEKEKRDGKPRAFASREIRGRSRNSRMWHTTRVFARCDLETGSF